MSEEEEKKYGYNDAVECVDHQKDMNLIEKTIDSNDWRKHKWIKGHNIDPNMQCPICKTIMRDPVYINNVKQHTFCRICIEQWFSNHNTNPMTNKKLNKKILSSNTTLKEQIALLYVSADRAQNDMDYYAQPHGLGDYTQVMPAHAKMAQKFFEENLQHLDADHYWSPWAKEKVMQLYGTVINFGTDDEDDLEHSLKMIDSLEEQTKKDITSICDNAKDDIRNATSNEERQQIINRVQTDVHWFRKIVNAIIWFFKTLWNVGTYPFKKIGDFVKWLFAFGENDTEQNNNYTNMR